MSTFYFTVVHLQRNNFLRVALCPVVERSERVLTYLRISSHDDRSIRFFEGYIRSRINSGTVWFVGTDKDVFASIIEQTGLASLSWKYMHVCNFSHVLRDRVKLQYHEATGDEQRELLTIAREQASILYDDIVSKLVK